MFSLNQTIKLSIAIALIYGTVLASCHLFSESEVLTSSILNIKLGPLTSKNILGWFDSWATLKDMPQSERLQLLIEENKWKNSLVMWLFPQALQDAMPHVVQTWLRCWILCAAVYFGVGAIWAYYGYFCFGDKLYAPGAIPAWKDVAEQMKVSNWSMPLYSVLPTLTEMAAEKGWTKAYPRIDNVGLPLYILYFFLYMTSVEFCVYWMHRLLHEIKWAYKYLHLDHHKYNKEHTLSPFAGLAFHPLDGILQAVPYAWTLFYCPMHFLTHEILLFATGVWTANIHDNIHGNVWPVMGAGYHTVHHTNYKTNYGHYFVFMDQIFGTLEKPEDYEQRKLKAQ
jgi:lathosterol oxidase